MTEEQNDKLHALLNKKLSIMSYKELADLKVNGQQAVKIKAGKPVKFYLKTLLRLCTLVKIKLD